MCTALANGVAAMGGGPLRTAQPGLFSAFHVKPSYNVITNKFA